uniref:Uncharacterized protein n=1 Tax=Monodelphis domestica TaxID=13616 RepID=A0A5F8H7Y9_MONDO
MVLAANSFKCLKEKALLKHSVAFPFCATLLPTRLCQSIILSVKAPACDVPSHFTLHVRWQTKYTNGVNSLICWLLPCIN